VRERVDELLLPLDGLEAPDDRDDRAAPGQVEHRAAAALGIDHRLGDAVVDHARARTGHRLGDRAADGDDDGGARGHEPRHGAVPEEVVLDPHDRRAAGREHGDQRRLDAVGVDHVGPAAADGPAQPGDAREQAEPPAGRHHVDLVAAGTQPSDEGPVGERRHAGRPAGPEPVEQSSR
jgi:hypothetical protein